MLNIYDFLWFGGLWPKSNQHFDNLLIWIYSRWSRFLNWPFSRREEDFSPKKTFSKNGILPNSFVYVRYTGPPLDDWVWIFVPCDHHCHDKLEKTWEKKDRGNGSGVGFVFPVKLLQVTWGCFNTVFASFYMLPCIGVPKNTILLLVDLLKGCYEIKVISLLFYCHIVGYNSATVDL